MPAYAILPAAGRSLRMGQSKLLLPWGEATIIETVLAAWQSSRVDRIYVVTHPDDAELAAICRRAGANVAAADVPPPDMKASIQLALETVRRKEAPTERDAWLVAPADIPQLSPRLVDRLLDAHDPLNPHILVPVCGPQRGHPVLFPWRLAEAVARLAPNQGLNALVDRNPIRQVECPPEEATWADIDTPEEYRHLRERHSR